MLKKLVRYGNSNALVLDKAILELLEIEEGSVVKIKTDGKSIIITPQEKVVSEKVHETFTQQEATFEAAAQASFEGYKGLPAEKKEALAKEMFQLMKKQASLYEQLGKNTDFGAAFMALVKRVGVDSPEYLKEYNELRSVYCPELATIEQEMAALGEKAKALSGNELTIPTLSQKDQKVMQQEVVEVFKKNNDISVAFHEALNNPDFQHETQLLVEKYAGDKNSSAYLEALAALTERYVPGWLKSRQELKAIGQRFAAAGK